MKKTKNKLITGRPKIERDSGRLKKILQTMRQLNITVAMVHDEAGLNIRYSGFANKFNGRSAFLPEEFERVETVVSSIKKRIAESI